MKKLPDEFKKLKRIKEPFKKRLYFTGILTKYLKKEDIKPIIVGGNAVEFYTMGYYSTADIDIIADGYEIIGKVLETWGFKKEGRHWYNEEFEIAIEIPASTLDEDAYDNVTEVEIDNVNVFIIGVEDLIIDRLNAYKWWKSLGDREWAKRLLKLKKNEIRFDYIEKKCKKQEIFDVFVEIKKEIEDENS
ncbi:MAG: DUF6036 family nucleotidyltransferase [Candidatus Ratteibacteria bacterium]|nr:DUF6036 family nucleotidyltransferase [Candidatus Ratteibacteria bacterium]